MRSDHHSGRTGLSAFRAQQRLATLHLGLLRPGPERARDHGTPQAILHFRRAMGLAYRLLFWAAIISLGFHWSRNSFSDSSSTLSAANHFPVMLQTLYFSRR